jgi:hypothetical protein
MSLFNQFTNLDFYDLRTQIKDYLRSNNNFSDFDFEGSNFSVLIDILAYNSYITSFNTNMAVNESYLDSATLRENVVSLAKNIGYIPRSKRAAKAKISFSVFALPFESKVVSLRAGIVALGAVEGGNYIFSIPEDIVVNVDNDGYANFDQIEIYEGNLLLKTFLYNSFNPQKFIIPNQNVDTTTIRVEIESQVKEKYKQFTSIFDANKDSKIFLLQEIEDEKYELIFGEGVLGKKPDNGSGIFVSYIVTNGKEANGARNFTFSGILEDNNGNRITSGISLLTTVVPAENGDDIESVESIKTIAPKIYSSQYRAVTATDYQGLVPYLFPNVQSVTAYGGEELDPPQYGKIFLTIKPRNGSFLSKASKEDIKNKLKQYTIAGTTVEIVNLKYLYVELDITAYYNKDINPDANALVASITKTVNDYSKTDDLNSFGGRFKYSKLVSLVDNTNKAITSNITKVIIRRNLNPAFGLLANYELCFGNEFYVGKPSYNIKSSGFKIANSSDTLYMSDVPASDNKTGRIFFFKLDGNNPFVVIQNAGKVDYIKGEITLNPIIIESSVNADGIHVQAVPNSNDILAYKDIYLELSIPYTKITVIEDTMSSGENVSGTQYKTTSSYSNGKFIR